MMLIFMKSLSSTLVFDSSGSDVVGYFKIQFFLYRMSESSMSRAILCFPIPKVKIKEGKPTSEVAAFYNT